MKKMQCEVCGSTDIKKIDDSTFECQSCGVQYSKNEVQKLLVEITGKVKIDHSEEVENTLKRAEQFEQEGHVYLAEQYYNKVLDLEPENDKAAERIDDIKKEKAKPRNIYWLKKNVSSENLFDEFIKNIKSLKGIAPDIYQEINVISKTEKYYPFAVYGGSYSGTYSGTACYKKEVPYQEEVIKEKFINGEFRKVREIVTKYRTEIDKKPSSGSYSASCRKICSLSKELNELISAKTPNQIDSVVYENNTHGICSNESLIPLIESYFTELYTDYCDSSEQIDLEVIQSEIPIDKDTIDSAWKKRAQEQYDSHVKSVCGYAAKNRIGGDYSEQVLFDYKTNSQSFIYLYIPIQVIEYAYRGNFYIAVTALFDKCNKLNLTYPYYNKINKLRNEGSNEVDRVSHKGMYGFIAWFFAALLWGLGWWTGFGGPTTISTICNTLAIACAILGALQTTLGVIKLIQANKLKKEYSQKTSKLTNEAVNELNKEFNMFFNKYSGIDSIEECAATVKNSSTFTCQIEEISCKANDGKDDEDYDEDDD